MKYSFLIVVFCSLIASCQSPKPRRPKQHSTSNFYQELVEKNRKLNQREKRYLEYIMAKDSTKKYLTSETGFWYTYIKKDSLHLGTPKPKDVVAIEFDITDVKGRQIYPVQQRDYKIDKEDFIPALQDGLKLMRKGEIITFVIPSYRAFGVTGDGNKIKINQPIKSTVKLISIKSQKDESN